MRFGLPTPIQMSIGRTPFSIPPTLAKAYSYIPDQMTLNVTGGFDIGASTAAKGIANNQTYALNDDLSIVKGSHQLGMGINVAYWKVDQQTWARGSGQWTFTGQATGLGMADFLLGRVAVLDHSGLTGITFDQKYLGGYLQDTWRANRRITINAGVRWEPFFSQNLLRGAITRFDREEFRRNVITTQFKNAPAGLIYPGDSGFPDGSTGLNTKWMNFAPRAGIGWDVHGDGRLAIRSLYGLSYDYPTGEFMSNPAAAPPYGNRIRLTDPPGGFDDPYGHLPGGDPHPIIPGPDTVFPASGTFASIDPDLNTPRIQSWNVTVEQQLGTNWQVSASYLGRYSDRLWGFNAVNYGVFMGLGPCTINGVAYHGVHDERKPAAAARAVAGERESEVRRADRHPRPVHQRRRPELSRHASVGATSGDDGPQRQRELHAVALLRARDGKRRRSSALHTRIPPIPTTIAGIAIRIAPTSRTPRSASRRRSSETRFCVRSRRTGVCQPS